MGQKVHPYSFRIGIIKDWKSRWYAPKRDYADRLLQDIKIRDLVMKELESAHVANVEIERASSKVRILIYSGRPGMVIGRKGAQIEKIKDSVQTILGVQCKLHVDIKEVTNPTLNAQLVADNLAFQLMKRVAFRRAMKKVVQAHKDAGGEGIKIKCSGRLGGAEIARAEGYKWGKIPLQTLRADIDYGFSEAKTTYGLIGIKVWIYKGEKFTRDSISSVKVEVKENEE